MLTHKIMFMCFAVLAISVGGIAVVSVTQSEEYLTEAAMSDLSHLTAMASEMCKVNAAETLKKVRADMQSARALFDNLSAGQVVIRDNAMILDPDGAAYVINDDTKFVDRIKEMTGAACTIFLKEGTKARRVSTSVVDTHGERAVGTYLSQPVFDDVVRDGNRFVGRAWVVDRWYVTAYEPIRDIHGGVVGVFFCGVPEQSESLRAGLLAQKIGATGYIYAINSHGVLQVHPAKEGADISKYEFIQEIMAEGPKLADGEVAWIKYDWLNTELGETTPREKIVAYAYFKEWDWILAAGSYTEEFTAHASNLQNLILMLGAVFMLISLAVGYFMSRSIARPIVQLVDVASGVAVGDISRTADIKARDEIGLLAKAFNSMIVYLRSAAGAAERIADNDLTVQVEPMSDKDQFGQAFQKMVGNLSDMIRQLADSARDLAGASTEIAASSQQMSQGASDQAEQVGQVSTAVEEMAATIIQTSKNAGEAAQASQRASETAGKGGDVVGETIQGMKKINDVVREAAESIAKLAGSADKIGEIISVIDDIADQTNLLALNAAIEAARAGEQGRGFAVVADEVRKLAERTGKATGEITEMIKGIQHETEDAVGSMESGIKQVDKGRTSADNAGESLREIVTITTQVLDMIQQIATAADEQSAAADEISKNVEHIASVTQESATGAQQSAKAAEEMNQYVERLNSMVRRFKVNA